MTFYTRTFDVNPGSANRSRPVEDEFALIAGAFSAVETKTNAALKAPDGESPAAMPAAADRANKSLAFDASGDPVATVAATSAEMTAAIAAATSAATSATDAATSAASVANSAAAIHLFLLAQGIR